MERLKLLMKRDGIISQYKLAKNLGIKLNVVNNWFTGVSKNPSEKYLKKVASCFHVHPAWLRYGDKEYAPTQDDEIIYIIKKAEVLGLREDLVRYGKLIINEAERSKLRNTRKGKTIRRKKG